MKIKEAHKYVYCKFRYVTETTNDFSHLIAFMIVQQNQMTLEKKKKHFLANKN